MRKKIFRNCQRRYVIHKNQLIDCLHTLIEEDILAKAMFIANYKEPDEAYFGGDIIAKLSENRFGVLVLFSARSDLEKVREQYSNQYQDFPLTTWFSQTECGQQLICELASLKKETGNSYAKVRQSYLKTQLQLKEAQNELVQKSSEYQRCISSLKSMKQEEAWLHQENTKQDQKVAALERELQDYTNALMETTQKIKTISDTISNLDLKLSDVIVQRDILLAEMNDIEGCMLDVTISLSQFSNLLKFSKKRKLRILKEEYHARLTVLKVRAEELNVLFVELEQQRVTDRETLAKKKQEREMLEKAIQKHTSSIAKLQKNFHTGKRMVDDGRSRMELMRHRLTMIEEQLQAVTNQVQEAKKKMVMVSQELLQSFFQNSFYFNENAKLYHSLFQQDKRLLETLFFYIPCMIASGTNAYQFFKENSFAETVLIYGFQPEKEDGKHHIVIE